LNELTDLGKEWMRYGGQEHPYQVFEVPPGGFLADQALEFIRETSRESRQLGMSFGIPHPRTGVVVKGPLPRLKVLTGTVKPAGASPRLQKPCMRRNQVV
jgi:hypothetical protein